MNGKLVKKLISQAQAMGVEVDSGCNSALDGYVQKYFGESEALEIDIIQTYLFQAALRIANSEKRKLVDGTDVKAAIWLYHQPSSPDDPCIDAGRYILEFERLRRTGKLHRLEDKPIDPSKVLLKEFGEIIDEADQYRSKGFDSFH